MDIVRQANEVWRRIGVTFREMVIDDGLTGRQVLDYHGQLYGLGAQEREKSIKELLALVELEEAADRRVKAFRVADTYIDKAKRFRVSIQHNLV